MPESMFIDPMDLVGGHGQEITARGTELDSHIEVNVTSTQFSNPPSIPDGQSPGTPTSRPPYIPQFSASTEMILNRMRESNLGSTVASSEERATSLQPAKVTYEDVKRRLVENLTTSLSVSLTMPMPSPPVASSSVSDGILTYPIAGIHAGTKRKRSADDRNGGQPNQPSALAEPNISQIPMKPISRPPIRKKKSRDDGIRRCAKCERLTWTANNILVTCPACEDCWHQKCHEPEISDELATNILRFKCTTCITEEQEMAKYREAKLEQAGWKRQHEISKLREKNLATLPPFNKPDMIGFVAGGASQQSRTEYFSSMRKTDLLNLLSFCDQIQPDLLVDILVSVSKRHADLPIFNSPDWAQSKTAGSNSPMTQHRNGGANLTNGHLTPPAWKTPKQRPRASAIKKILKHAPAVEAIEAAMDDDDILPPSWPKPGHGLYARLPPESEDMHLVDVNDEEAFSQFMVDSYGKQIMESVSG